MISHDMKVHGQPQRLMKLVIKRRETNKKDFALQR